MLEEFKKFISKGNVLDLAVAVVIGAAFGAIVTSLVKDIIMPIVGVVMGGVDFTGLKIQVGEATVNYGNFIQMTVNFLIISFAVFLMVQSFKKFKKPPAPTPEPTVPNDEKLLMEIRDLLKAR